MEDTIQTLYRNDFRRLFATLVRLLGDFDLAEDALQEAFTIAIQRWPRDGLPARPDAWLVSTARFKAIDRLRKESRLVLGQDILLEATAADPQHSDPVEHYDQSREIEDDRLRLIFTCCHPALAMEVQVALTLREICGLSTEAIASAFLIPSTTLAQRLVRGKAKIRKAGLPYVVPGPEDLPARLEAVLSVIYLVFNAGYRQHDDPAAEVNLAAEAIRLARLLQSLQPDPEVAGLLALMLLTEARRPARRDARGAIVLLAEQDRQRWDQAMIAEGKAQLASALAVPALGSYTLQAAIADTHASARRAEDTDWGRIVALYDLLIQAQPSPVVALNRAVALAMRDGPAIGLQALKEVVAGGTLATYAPAHLAQADMQRQLGDRDAAVLAYQQALALLPAGPEHDFIADRLDELAAASPLTTP